MELLGLVSLHEKAYQKNETECFLLHYSLINDTNRLEWSCSLEFFVKISILRYIRPDLLINTLSTLMTMAMN